MATRRILIVDDDVDALKMIGLMLESKGYQIIAAANGKQAIQKAVQTRPHLIILDIMMPGMDGYEVTSRLRQLPSTRDIPILVFTGKSQPQDRSDALNAGADEYLTKPIHPEELAARIERLLKRPSRPARSTSGPLPPSQPVNRVSPLKQGQSYVFLPVKGGIGNSTLVLNTAVEFKRMKPDMQVALVELQDGGGSIAMQAGVQVRKGLAALAATPVPSALTPEAIAAAMVQHQSGVDMLLNMPRPRGADFTLSLDTVNTILTQLNAEYDIVLLDVLPNLNTLYAAVAQNARQIFLTLEANKLGIELARSFLYRLEALNIDRENISLVVIHRVPAYGNVSKPVIEQTLHYDMVSVIPPAADLAYESLQSGRPMVQIQENGVVTQQVRRIIQLISQNM